MFLVIAFKPAKSRLFKDGTSSIYSRPPKSPKGDLLSEFKSRPLPSKHDLPEINSLDY